MMAATGIVKIHPQTIRRVTPQRTAVARRAEPTPEIAPVMTCVVLTGTPKAVAVNMLAAAELSAQIASGGVSLVIF